MKRANKHKWSSNQTRFTGGEHTMKQAPVLMKIWHDSHTNGGEDKVLAYFK